MEGGRGRARAPLGMSIALCFFVGNFFSSAWAQGRPSPDENYDGDVFELVARVCPKTRYSEKLKNFTTPMPELVRACNHELESQDLRQGIRESQLVCPETTTHARVIKDPLSATGTVFVEEPKVLAARCRREFAAKPLADREAVCRAAPRLCVGWYELK
jgi:hypothetical protein